jgi:hypothetical protein
MILLTAKIINISPLHIGSGETVGTFYPTLDYIPARILRGMVGNYLYHHDKEIFNTLKIDNDLEPKIFFKPALPEGTISSPLILRWCKKCRKLLRGDAEDCSCFHEGKKKSGLIKKESIENEKWEAPNIKKTTSTKCPIIRTTHTSPGKDYSLSPFNIEAIIRKKSFDFKCLVESDYVETLMEILRNAGLFYGVGGFRSKGYGTIAFESFHEESVEDYIERRAKELNSESLLMTLNSPAIFKNKEQYQLGFTAEVLEKYFVSSLMRLNRKFTDVKLLGKSSFQQTYARGWTLKGNYRLTELIPAMDRGSAVELQLEGNEAAAIEVTSIGELPHIYGDVYFIGGI